MENAAPLSRAFSEKAQTMPQDSKRIKAPEDYLTGWNSFSKVYSIR